MKTLAAKLLIFAALSALLSPAFADSTPEKAPPGSASSNIRIQPGAEPGADRPKIRVLPPQGMPDVGAPSLNPNAQSQVGIGLSIPFRSGKKKRQDRKTSPAKAQEQLERK